MIRIDKQLTFPKCPTSRCGKTRGATTCSTPCRRVRGSAFRTPADREGDHLPHDRAAGGWPARRRVVMFDTELAISGDKLKTLMAALDARVTRNTSEPAARPAAAGPTRNHDLHQRDRQAAAGERRRAHRGLKW